MIWLAVRYVFWSDWSQTPFIARIGMDGSQMKKIITTDIYWPNCVTIDYTTNRLFWVDAQTIRLECVFLTSFSKMSLF